MKFTLILASLLAGVSAMPTGELDSRATSAEITQWLKAHNDERAAHGAAALTWNQALADKAADWANGCVFEHSNAGQNLAATFSEHLRYDQRVEGVLMTCVTCRLRRERRVQRRGCRQIVEQRAQ